MRHLVLLLLLAVAACGGESRTPPCLDQVGPAPDGVFATFETTDAGRLHVAYEDGLVLDVPLGPQRIVSTAPGLTESIAYLDGLKHLVGVTPWCNYPAGVDAVAKVAVIPLDIEGIVALKPDLVVADRTLHRSRIDALRRRFPGALLLLETSRSLAHYRHSVAILTRALGDERALRRGRRLLVEQFAVAQETLAAHVRKAAFAGWRPRVLVVSQWEPLYVEGPGGLMHDMLRLCGCTNVACDLGQASGTFNEELVLERRPDVILYREGPPPERLRKRWAGVPAFKSGRLGSCASDAFSRGGPRIVGALEQLWAVFGGDAPWASLADVR